MHLINVSYVMLLISVSVLNHTDVIYCIYYLFTVYYYALWFITSDVYSTHHCILYEKVRWSSLSERRDMHMYLFMYKAFIGKPPSFITSVLFSTFGFYVPINWN